MIGIIRFHAASENDDADVTLADNLVQGPSTLAPPPAPSAVVARVTDDCRGSSAKSRGHH